MDKALRGLFRSTQGILGSLIFAAATSKWIAIIGGTAGLGIYGQLKNLQQTVLTFGTVNGQTAFVQGVASRKGTARWEYVLGASLISLAAVILLLTLGWGAAPWIATRVLGNQATPDVAAVRLAVAGGALYVFASIGSYILNGLGLLRLTARTQMAGSAGLLAGAMLFIRHEPGPLEVGSLILLGGAVALSVSAWLLGRYRIARLRVSSHSRTEIVRGAQQFGRIAGTMALAGGIGALTRFLIRAHVVAASGVSAAGLFEAAWTASMTYMGLLLSSLGGYLLPTLSAESYNSGRSQLIDGFLRVAVACGLPLISGVLLFRHEVIRVLYSSSIAPAADLLAIMVAGDYLKLVSWILVMPMLAAAQMRAFLGFEIVWNAGFLLLSILLSKLGLPILPSIGYAFVICYLGNTIGASIYFVKRNDLRIRTQSIVLLVIGFLIIIGQTLAMRFTEDIGVRIALLMVSLAFTVWGLGREGLAAVYGFVKRKV